MLSVCVCVYACVKCQQSVRMSEGAKKSRRRADPERGGLLRSASGEGQEEDRTHLSASVADIYSDASAIRYALLEVREGEVRESADDGDASRHEEI